jgi:hypothetical protein
MKKLISIAVLGLGLNLTAALAFEKEELSGKWEGTTPLGDSLELTLQVNGDEIAGTGSTPPKGKRAGASPTVEGKIKNNSVVLTTSNYAHQRESHVTYHCSWEEPKLLNCHVKAKNFDTQFKKLD